MTYSPIVARFIEEGRFPRVSRLDPVPDGELIAEVRNTDDQTLAGANGARVVCLRALLLLAAGEVELAHGLVQNLETADAAYLHGMIHRIDDDFGNAGYWFRRAGVHPAGAEIYRRAVANSIHVATRPVWDPDVVTEMVETARQEGISDELRAVLKIESEVLVEHLHQGILDPGHV